MTPIAEIATSKDLERHYISYLTAINSLLSAQPENISNYLTETVIVNDKPKTNLKYINSFKPGNTFSPLNIVTDFEERKLAVRVKMDIPMLFGLRTSAREMHFVEYDEDWRICKIWYLHE